MLSGESIKLYIGSPFIAMKLNRYVYKIIKRTVRERIQCLFNFFLLVETINKTILLQEFKTPFNSDWHILLNLYTERSIPAVISYFSSNK